MSRSVAVAFGIAGVLSVGRWTLDLTDADYYDPVTLLDYSAVILQTGAGLATGMALLLLWRDPPVKRGSFLLGIAGLSAIVFGLGNLLEDAFEMEWAVWGFFGGGIGMILSLAVAGITALTVDSPRRWSGLFLLVGATGGMLGAGLLAMGIAWLAFSIWITRRVAAENQVLAIAS